MFSAGYREENLRKMDEQENYESSGIRDIMADGRLAVWQEGGALYIHSAQEGSAKVRVYDAGGRLAYESAVTLAGGDTAVGLPGLPAGVYVAAVETETARSSTKIALR